MGCPDGETGKGHNTGHCQHCHDQAPFLRNGGKYDIGIRRKNILQPSPSRAKTTRFRFFCVETCIRKPDFYRLFEFFCRKCIV